MKSAKALTVILILAIILISGCSKQEFKPGVNLEIDKTSVTVTDNQVSKEFITATITRTDDNDKEAVFVLSFPDKLQSAMAVDTNGIRISELQTKPLVGLNAKDILQFKIYGRKGEAASADFDIKAELWWNSTKVEGQTRTIRVSVR